MGMVLLVLVFLVAGLCLARKERGCRRFLADVAALLYLPVGTLMTLIKKCK